MGSDAEEEEADDEVHEARHHEVVEAGVDGDDEVEAGITLGLPGHKVRPQIPHRFPKIQLGRSSSLIRRRIDAQFPQ